MVEDSSVIFSFKQMDVSNILSATSVSVVVSPRLGGVVPEDVVGDIELRITSVEDFHAVNDGVSAIRARVVAVHTDVIALSLPMGNKCGMKYIHLQMDLGA